MSRVFVQDRIHHKVTHREYTDEGFLKVPGRVAKTGTQQYLRKELGLDGNPNEIVTVYRPPEEVFNADSLATYNAADITILHPKKLVDSTTFKDTTAGVVSSQGRQDGDFVVCDLIVKDAQAIKQIESGLVELSAGYTAEYVHAPGVTADGVEYEYLQRDIRINHVALVPTARAGRQARIFDQDRKEIQMSKVTLDSGREVEVQDAATALLISDTIERLRTQVADATKAKDEAESEAEKQKAKADAKEEEAEEAKKASTEDAISARIAEIVAVKDKAAVIDAGYTADGVDTNAIMRGVLSSVRPTIDWATKSDAYVQAAFDMAHETAKEGGSVKNAQQLRNIAQDAAAGAAKATQTSVRDQYVARFSGKEAK
jgi:hypothetical protein